MSARLKLTEADKLHRFLNKEGGVGNLAEGHYAIQDPYQPGRVTLWRIKGGEFEAWPIRTRVGPIQAVDWSACPREREYEARRVFIDYAWDRQREYFAEVRRLIGLNPTEAAARYSSATVCCSFCNRALKDPESIGYGVGSDCRRWLPAEYKARLAEGISRIRAEVQLPEAS